MSRFYPPDPRAACGAFGAEVGPCTQRLLAEHEVLEAVVARMLTGTELRDAVLSAAFRQFRDEGQVRLWVEMLAYAYDELRMASSRTARRRTRATLESAEVLHSMIVSLWDGAQGFEYRTYPEFIAYLTTRFRWRWDSHRREQELSGARTDARHGPDAVQQDGLEADGLSHEELVGARELMVKLEEVLAGLLPEDRRAFELWLHERKSYTVIAQELGMHRTRVARIVEQVTRRLKPRDGA